MEIIEIWKDIADFESFYQISDLGRVKSLSRIDHRGYKWSGRISKQSKDSDNYLIIKLNKNGSGRMCKVHRLVALAFIPNPESKPHVNHMDGNKTNNTVGNLEWMTSQENKSHAVDMGLVAKGSKHGRSKLKDPDILEIRKRLLAGEYQANIARDYGIGQAAISKIKTRENWSHIQTVNPPLSTQAE